MLHPIVKKYLTEFLIFFWLFVTAPPILLIGWLVSSQQNLFLGIPLFFSWFLVSWWLGLTTARHMCEEDLMFLSAIKHTFYDLRLMLAFVPLIGRWFAPDEHKTKNDDDA
jgi:hypothetical protein